MGLLYSLLPLLIFPSQEGCGHNGVFARMYTVELKSVYTYGTYMVTSRELYIYIHRRVCDTYLSIVHRYTRKIQDLLNDHLKIRPGCIDHGTCEPDAMGLSIYSSSHIHTYLHTYLPTYMHTCIHAKNCTHALTHARTHPCIHPPIHPYTRSCIHIYKVTKIDRLDWTGLD